MFIKFFSQTASTTLISLLSVTSALAEPILTRFPNITPDSLNTSPPICFAQISTNQVIDLSSICGFRSPSICNIELGESSDKSRLLAEFCQKNQRCEQTGNCDQQPLGLPNNTFEPQG